MDDLREALRNIDIKAAMRTALGKCPHCNDRLVYDQWLRWCENRRCRGWVGPISGSRTLSVERENLDYTERLRRLFPKERE